MFSTLDCFRIVFDGGQVNLLGRNHDVSLCHPEQSERETKKKKKGSEMGIQTASSSLSERLWMIKIGITNLEHRERERERESQRV